MTPPPQREYITTDSDFDFIWKNIDSPLVVRDRINVIKSRSRPHTPTQDKTCPCDIEMSDVLPLVSTTELVEELSKRIGVRAHTSVEGTYCRVFVGENDSGKILTWQTEHGKARILEVKD